jgi:hypothetical protein
MIFRYSKHLRGQKKELDRQELELQVAVSHSVENLGSEPGFSAGISSLNSEVVSATSNTKTRFQTT